MPRKVRHVTAGVGSLHPSSLHFAMWVLNKANIEKPQNTGKHELTNENSTQSIVVHKYARCTMEKLRAINHDNERFLSWVFACLLA